MVLGNSCFTYSNGANSFLASRLALAQKQKSVICKELSGVSLGSRLCRQIGGSECGGGKRCSGSKKPQDVIFSSRHANTVFPYCVFLISIAVFMVCRYLRTDRVNPPITPHFSNIRRPFSIPVAQSSQTSQSWPSKVETRRGSPFSRLIGSSQQ